VQNDMTLVDMAVDLGSSDLSLPINDAAANDSASDLSIPRDSNMMGDLATPTGYGHCVRPRCVDC